LRGRKDNKVRGPSTFSFSRRREGKKRGRQVHEKGGQRGAPALMAAYEGKKRMVVSFPRLPLGTRGKARKGGEGGGKFHWPLPSGSER